MRPMTGIYDRASNYIESRVSFKIPHEDRDASEILYQGAIGWPAA